MEKRRLCIDVNSVLPLFVRGYLTGVGKTTFELLQALAKMKNLPFDVTLYSQNTKGIGGDKLQLPFDNKHLYYPYRDKWNKVLSCFPVKEIYTSYNLMHIPHNFDYLFNPSRSVITLHDALFMKMQESEFEHGQLKKQVPPLMRKCKDIVTCSEASKQDIIETMNIPPEKITVIPWGVSHDIFYPASKEEITVFRQKYAISDPYFLMISCNAGRKNTLSLMRSFEKYLSEGGKHRLVLLWSNPPDFVLHEFKEELQRNKIIFLSNLQEYELRPLYSAAEAFFYPSRYEGFGLPILESMSCGTPVVTCRNSSLQEVGGDMAFYTGPDDLDRMAQYMFDFEHKSQVIERSPDDLVHYASTFTWENTAKSYVDFYIKNM